MNCGILTKSLVDLRSMSQRMEGYARENKAHESIKTKLEIEKYLLENNGSSLGDA